MRNSRQVISEVLSVCTAGIASYEVPALALALRAELYEALVN